MKIGVVQPRRDAEDYEGNIETAMKQVAAAPRDLDLLHFPEGFPGPWWIGPDERGTLVGFGVTDKFRGRLYNAYALTSAEGLFGIYRKLLPAAFELLAPSLISQANEVKVWDIKGVKVGASICLHSGLMKGGELGIRRSGHRNGQSKSSQILYRS